jgi:putative intracellular protease/amidase/plastocyanin
MTPMPFLMALVLFFSSPLPATAPDAPQSSDRPRNVAVLVYDGMEILDFAGPGEVFAAAGKAFNVYTVGAKSAPILSQRFVTITPRYTIHDAPAPDILVIPGGGSQVVTANPELMKWVGDSARRAEIVLTVCTGAFVLAETGLLDGLEATTWHGAIAPFRAAYPKTTVRENVRWVDNGKFVTTAGVSAGIDGALHVVAKLLGGDAAKTTARYMEYDKWEPGAGVVAENDVNRRYEALARERAEALTRSGVPAVNEGGAEVVTIAVTDSGFEPAVVTAKAGAPIRLTFDRRTSSRCLEAVKIPSLDVPARALAVGARTTIELSPVAAGTYEFTCGMEMFRGKLVVRE